MEDVLGERSSHSNCPHTHPIMCCMMLDAFLELLHNSGLTADKGTGSPLHRSYSDEALSEEKPTSPVPPGGTPK